MPKCHFHPRTVGLSVSDSSLTQLTHTNSKTQPDATEMLCWKSLPFFSPALGFAFIFRPVGPESPAFPQFHLHVFLIS